MPDKGRQGGPRQGSPALLGLEVLKGGEGSKGMEVQTHRTREGRMVKDVGCRRRQKATRSEKVRHPKGVDRPLRMFEGGGDETFDRIVLVSSALRRQEFGPKPSVSDHHLATVAGVFVQDDRLGLRRTRGQGKA